MYQTMHKMRKWVSVFLMVTLVISLLPLGLVGFAAGESSALTIYYKPGAIKKPSIHHNLGNALKWATTPMEEAESGYYKISVDLKDQATLKAVFTDGTVWDNNFKTFYEFAPGTYTVFGAGGDNGGGTWKKGAPGAEGTKVFIIYDMADKKWADVNLYFTLAADAKSGWSTGSGEPMTKIEGTSLAYTIKDLGTAKMTAVFNNGKGAWDNNKDKNFVFEPGVYTIDNGNQLWGFPIAITKNVIGLQPVSEEKVTATATPEASPSPSPSATVTPTVEPTVAPTAEPTVEPTVAPTVEPTPAQTNEPEPTVEPVKTSTVKATMTIPPLPEEDELIIPGDEEDVVPVKTKAPVKTIAPKKTVAPKQKISVSSVTADVYVKSASKSVKIYVRTNGGKWSPSNGVQMKAAAKGYFKHTISFKSNQKMEVKYVDTKHKGTKVYRVYAGNNTIENNAIKKLIPSIMLKTVTVYYYNTSFEQPYFMYRTVGGKWIAAPGVKMGNSNVEGFVWAKVKTDSAKGIEGYFTDGDGLNDDQDGKPFKIGVGTYHVIEGVLTKGVPEPSADLFINPDDESGTAIDLTTDGDQPVETEMPVAQETPKPTVAPTSKPTIAPTSKPATATPKATVAPTEEPTPSPTPETNVTGESKNGEWLGIQEPTTGSKYTHVVNARLNLAKEIAGKTAKVDMYYAIGDAAFAAQPAVSQKAIADRSDYFFSADLSKEADTKNLRVKFVAVDASGTVLASQEIAGIWKTNANDAYADLKDGATVIKKDGKVSAIRFAVWSNPANKVQVWLYGKEDKGEPVKVIDLAPQAEKKFNGTYWAAEITSDALLMVEDGILYGLRVWGPNFAYDNQWRPGTVAGFKQDVDKDGNRFNPNKMLIDPYARAYNKEPDLNNRVFLTGEGFRQTDSAKAQGKSIAFDYTTYDWEDDKPLQIPWPKTSVYEVHVKGFTAGNGAGVENPGTFKGMVQKASHFQDLGVSSIELLPIFDSPNENKTEPGQENYWGYMTLNYFMPDRKYSSDKSPTGPVKEFREFVKGMHKAGKEVFLDVVYNHTAEGGIYWLSRDEKIHDNGRVALVSFKGIDNATYYGLSPDKQTYSDNSGTGSNFNVSHPKVTQFVLDSLRYWIEEMHVDGFRYDLASILGNSVQIGYKWDKNHPLINRIIKEFPNTKMLAEPWAIGEGSYQVGNFPVNDVNPWAEWQDKFRQTIRKTIRGDQYQVKDLATRVAGSGDLYGDDGRNPYHSINYVVSHDGFTLNDLVTYTVKQNNQAYPYGPSDGGPDYENSSNYNNDPALQKQAIRNAAMYLFTSAGTPMMLGGDEMRRTQRGNNNTYNLDTVVNWYDWNWMKEHAGIYNFYKGIISIRNQHPALQRSKFYTGKDNDGDGFTDISWHGAKVGTVDWDGPNTILAWRIDGSKAETGADKDDHDFYIAANHTGGKVTFQLPPNSAGKKWYRLVDTSAWAENSDSIKNNVDTLESADMIKDAAYEVNGGAMIMLVEK